jgi:hypothetical protein
MNQSDDLNVNKSTMACIETSNERTSRHNSAADTVDKQSY